MEHIKKRYFVNFPGGHISYLFFNRNKERKHFGKTLQDVTGNGYNKTLLWKR